jgi:hypothetical protein
MLDAPYPAFLVEGTSTYVPICAVTSGNRVIRCARSVCMPFGEPIGLARGVGSQTRVSDGEEPPLVWDVLERVSAAVSERDASRR